MMLNNILFYNACKGIYNSKFQFCLATIILKIEFIESKEESDMNHIMIILEDPLQLC